MTQPRKKRIFICNDASYIHSGYGIYGKELLSRLHNSGKYEVAELGCYTSVGHPSIKDIPWKFYPNAVAFGDPRISEFQSQSLNQFGQWRFNQAILDFKPDIVFDIRDYWMSSYQEISPYRAYFHWILMPTVDSAPQKLEWLYTFANADLVVPYTDWARQSLLKAAPTQINLFPKIANAGINATDFFPLLDKKEHQLKAFGKEVSIIGLVMRNQKRKLLPDIMIAYKMYLDKLLDTNQLELYSKTFLYLHTSYPEEIGWDIPSLLLEYNLLDKVYFTYYCASCFDFSPSKFRGATTICSHCGKNSARMSGVIQGVNTAQLNLVYNLFDIFIQYAICEGFGMPQIEAAACGLQIASVDYSAMSEVTESVDGIKIPVEKTFREMESNAIRVYPDIKATAEIIYEYLVNTTEIEKAQKSIIIRRKCLDKYTWDDVYKIWDECFDTIDIKNKLPWDYPEKSPTYQSSISTDLGLNPREFVESICLKIINEPLLLKCAPIQKMIKELSEGISTGSGFITAMHHEKALKSLETYLKNKVSGEILRLKPETPDTKKEDFLL